MPTYISDEKFTHLRNNQILYEGYVIGVGYAYKNTIDPGRSGSHGLKCNLATIKAQYIDVSHEAYNKSFLEMETAARQSSTHVEPHWKEKLSDYPYHKVDGDKEDPEEDKVVNSLIAFLRVMCSIKLSGSGDYVGNGGPFSTGTFLTLTSENGGSGPAIHSSGNIKIIYVDVDTLPGLLGLARGKGKLRYKSRNGHESSRLAKALEAVPVPNEIFKGKDALIKVKTSVQEALMTELRASDQFFNTDTDSALVKGKSAWEMAGEHRIDTVAVPKLNEKGEIVGYVKWPTNQQSNIIVISKDEYNRKPSLSPNGKYKNVKGWSK